MARSEPLTAIDRFLTDVRFRSAGLGRRHSWRLARALRRGLAGVHEGVLTVGRRRGWSPVPPDLLDAMQRAAPKEAPRYPGSAVPPGRVSTQARLLRDGIMPLANGQTMPLDRVSWRQDPFGDTRSTARFLFHALYGVVDLLQAYRLGGDAAYLAGAREVARRWIAECLYSERVELIWDDHVTALRAIALCQLWDGCWADEPKSSPFARDLLAAIVRHGEKLAHEAFYRADHNHGVTQAYALLAVGLLFPQHPRAAVWVESGRRRLEAQIVLNVSADGFHREHSPYYHFFVFRQFFQAYRLAQSYGVAFSPGFVARLLRMLAAGAHLLKPDGSLAALGDTCVGSPVLVEREELDGEPAAAFQACLYSRTQGAAGAAPAETSVISAEAGFVVLRSAWGTAEPFADERYLAFRLSTLPTTHIHRDAFTFELYGYGQGLVVDSGGPFEYGHPMRRGYFLTTRAHNTVVVDREEQRVGAARIVRWAPSPDHDVLVAEHENVPGVVHRRAVVFVRPSYVVILDRLTAEVAHRYAQVFHLHPALDVRIRDLAVFTDNRNDGATLTLVPLGIEDLGLRLQRGTLNPSQGWVCTGNRLMVPGFVVEYLRTGTDATFAALLVPAPPGRPAAVAARLEGRPLVETVRLEVSVDGRRDTLVIEPDGRLAFTRTGA